ncbi:hypothetical protein [Streptomyces gibsoniae]|uniref:Uncharacterized protein n=1 Tax=Streptomyces gibsoniae TaxID=3075529 RepID=A0ABU2TTR3_9ACTN|nr:hypothetical protein [Streptomyces sp. DSM 41699]MDT0464338.1 hypothetical protein [Streptomyces sp. DSM 41699]
MTEPLAPRPAAKAGRWTKQSAGATFAAAAALAFTRDVAFETFKQVLPDWAYTATTVVGLIAAAGAYCLALLWLRRLP